MAGNSSSSSSAQTRARDPTLATENENIRPVIPNLNEAVPESVTMETLLAYTADAAKYRSDSRRSSYQNELVRNLKNRRMTRLVMAIGIVLLVMSVILVGITLSLSEHIDKMGMVNIHCLIYKWND